MTNITISARTHSLVLTKSFAAKAAIFGTDEYKMLQEARRDYPGYKVTVGKSKEAKKLYQRRFKVAKKLHKSCMEDV